MSVTFEIPLKLKRQEDGYSNGTSVYTAAIPGMSNFCIQVNFFTHENAEGVADGLATQATLVRNNANYPSLSTTGLKVIFTLYDHVGHIIGISDIIQNAHAYATLYRNEQMPGAAAKPDIGARLQLKHLLRHLAPEMEEDAIIIQMKAWVEDGNIRAMKHITGQPLIPNEKPPGEKCEIKPVTFIIGGKDVAISAVMVHSLIKESEFFRTLLSKYEKDAKAVQIEDVEPKTFRRFVEFVHHKRCVYLRSVPDEATLQECCREMLVLANKWLCQGLAKMCAECIVHVTQKATLFDDVYFLEKHYQGNDKLEIIAELAPKVKEFKPEDKEKNLKKITKKLNNVSFAFLSKLTE